MTILEQKVDDLLRPLLKDEGLELVSVRFFTENEQNFLELGIRLFEGQTTLTEVEIASRFISEWLDKYDFIENAYILDVYAVSSK